MRAIGWLTAAFAFLLLAAGLLRNVILSQALEWAFDSGKYELVRKGVAVSLLNFESARFTSPRSFEISGFRLDVDSERPSAKAGDGSSVAGVKHWTADAETMGASLFLDHIDLSSRGLKLDAQGAGEFEGDVPRVRLAFDLSSPGSYRWYVAKAYKNLQAIVKTGRAEIPYDVAGSLRFQVKGSSFTTRIMTETTGYATALLMDPKDVVLVAKGLDDCLSADEVAMVSRHPIQAPRLYRLKNYAKETAAGAAAADRKIPRGSYRHILWSYRLTKEFDADLAQQQTDAHETGDCEPSEKEDVHEMDRHNNAVGRRYAQEGVPESQIVPKLLSDKTVLRKWY